MARPLGLPWWLWAYGGLLMGAFIGKWFGALLKMEPPTTWEEWGGLAVALSVVLAGLAWLAQRVFPPVKVAFATAARGAGQVWGGARQFLPRPPERNALTAVRDQAQRLPWWRVEQRAVPLAPPTNQSDTLLPLRQFQLGAGVRGPMTLQQRCDHFARLLEESMYEWDHGGRSRSPHHFRWMKDYLHDVLVPLRRAGKNPDPTFTSPLNVHKEPTRTEAEEVRNYLRGFDWDEG